VLLIDEPTIRGNEMCRLSGRHGKVFYCGGAAWVNTSQARLSAARPREKPTDTE
jgi:hypothetical protein